MKAKTHTVQILELQPVNFCHLELWKSSCDWSRPDLGRQAGGKAGKPATRSTAAVYTRHAQKMCKVST